MFSFTESADSYLSYSDTIAVDSFPKENAAKFLTQSLTEPVNINPLAIEVVYQEWQLITLGLALLLIAFIRIGSRSFFKNAQSAFFSLPIFKQMIRDDELFPQGSIVPLAVANILVTTTLLYNIIERTGSKFFQNESDLSFKVINIILLLFGYYTFQFVLLHLTGFIFKTRQTAVRQISNINYYRFVSSLILIPLLMFYIYSSSLLLLKFAVTLWIIIYLIRLWRGLIIVLDEQGYSGFQNLLYICALEILPVFVLAKLIVV